MLTLAQRAHSQYTRTCITAKINLSTGLTSFVRATFCVVRCLSLLPGRASELLSIDVNRYILFAFVRSKSLVIAGFAIRMGVEYGTRHWLSIEVCSRPLYARFLEFSLLSFTTDCYKSPALLHMLLHAAIYEMGESLRAMSRVIYTLK